VPSYLRYLAAHSSIFSLCLFQLMQPRVHRCSDLFLYLLALRSLFLRGAFPFLPHCLASPPVFTITPFNALFDCLTFSPLPRQHLLTPARPLSTVQHFSPIFDRCTHPLVSIKGVPLCPHSYGARNAHVERIGIMALLLGCSYVRAFLASQGHTTVSTAINSVGKHTSQVLQA
jgi:hypothetical protein